VRDSSSAVLVFSASDMLYCSSFRRPNFLPLLFERGQPSMNHRRR
jgi:hypothetical protein